MHILSSSNYIEQFRTAMRNSGIGYNGEIIADGAIHRFHVEGDSRGSINGWYWLASDCFRGSFGSWRTGVKEKWSERSHQNMNPVEREEQRKKHNEAIRQNIELLKQKQAKAAKRATEIWNSASPASMNHPYLVSKRISPYIARQRSGQLILPVCDFQGNLYSLQFISADGSKILLKEGIKHRMHIPITGLMHASSTLLICEGFATGATLASLCPTASVIGAIDAGNLEAVAVEARIHFPTASIVICGDDDRNTLGNPGVTFARQAANAIGASFSLPTWPVGAPDTLTDYNDLACWLADNEEFIV